jgi:predicted phosphohydrolase
MMRVFAIGDVHLPGGPRAKSMERFGEIWRDHVATIERNWHEVAREDDVLLVVGDLSWAMKVEEAAEDLAWLKRLRGHVVVIRGNHDFWWSGIGRVRAALAPVIALQHDHVILGDVAIVGTRGWQCPGSAGSADLMVDRGGGEEGSFVYSEADRAIYEREAIRLKLGLDGLKKSKAAFSKLIVALHYPPMNPAHESSKFTELVDEAGADVCVHGHLHGAESIATAFEGTRGKTRYHCVSADAVAMRPRCILET